MPPSTPYAGLVLWMLVWCGPGAAAVRADAPLEGQDAGPGASPDPRPPTQVVATDRARSTPRFALGTFGRAPFDRGGGFMFDAALVDHLEAGALAALVDDRAFVVGGTLTVRLARRAFAGPSLRLSGELVIGRAPEAVFRAAVSRLEVGYAFLARRVLVDAAGGVRYGSDGLGFAPSLTLRVGYAY